ncbi:hypothetical protein NQ317_009581 [Molorchus minor]|uniref:Double jelly roll-like domain-containing protein n=1 Tax=Molorchus minor TaxID=1323400 RepID=A0ABQ9IZU0_9CUCU|nr:hypothetical protein NQ317_009581 [Molorchus minor]
MLEELQLFQDPNFDESIVREEVRTYYPFVKSFGNNDEVEIAIYQQDSILLMSEAAIIIEGTLKKNATGTGTIEFTNNAGAFLFDSISYELNGKEVDKVRDPGTVSLLKGYLCYEKEDSSLSIGGWNYPEGHLVTYDPTKSTFYLRIPLWHLLGFFHDYKKIIFGKQILRLIRSRTDNNCFKVSKDDTNGELTITNIELKVKHVFLNDVIKMNLLSQINTDRPILMPYRQWELHELPSLTNGTTKEIWSVKTCSNMESPRYIIVAFQTNRKEQKKRDVTFFDNIEISNIRLTLNSEYYPYEDMKLDFSSKKYHEAYFMYTQFSKLFASNNKPMLDYEDFNSRALFVIDCSKRNDSIKSSTVDVKLEIESRNSFPQNTKAYCIIIHDRVMEYLALSGVYDKSLSNMKLVVVDMQGFNLSDFYPKEISFVNGQQNTHYLLKPPVPYRTLSCDVKKQVKYLESNFHGLKYSSGYVSDDDLNEILRNHLLNSNVDFVYVKGHQKKEFLEKRLFELGGILTPSVVNVEHLSFLLQDHLFKLRELKESIEFYEEKQYMFSSFKSLNIDMEAIFRDKRPQRAETKIEIFPNSVPENGKWTNDETKCKICHINRLEAKISSL